MSDAKPQYCGVTTVEVHFAEVADRHPEISKLVDRGSAFALPDSKGLLAQRNGRNTIRVYITLCVSESWVTESGISFDRPEEARAQLLQLFADWNNSLVNLIQHCDASFTPRPLYMLPVEHKWETKQGVALIGDAAHLMSPFAGEGVNLAMLDATELALVIASTNDLTESVHDFEQKMFARATEAARQSSSNLDLLFSPGNSAKKNRRILPNNDGNGPPNNDETHHSQS